MDDAELERLLGDIESDRTERKASLANKSAIEEAICAFANDLPDHRRPGVVFVGVHDDGKPSGFAVADEALRELADIRSSGNILPLPAMTVQKRRLAGVDLAVVVVEPADAPPVNLRGRVRIRIGPRRAIASPQEERQLAEKRRGRDLPFDARPLTGASLDDFDLELFQEEYLPTAVAPDILAANERSLPDQLSALRFTSPEGVPTPTGILLSGREPESLLPGAYIQFLRLDGPDLSAPIKDSKRVAGPLVHQLLEIEETLRVNLSTALDIDGGQEIATPDVPIAALQQLVRNAVLHRSYEGTNAPVRVTWLADRVEIQSPGGPFGQATVENFGRPGVTDYRNPTLAEALRAAGFIQRFGIGIPLARKALAVNGNPELVLVAEATHVLATVRSRP